MKTADFNYVLPEGMIAQHPAPNRSESRMIVVYRKTGQIEHKIFKDIICYIEPSDLLVLNNAKVFPARLFGKKEQGGAKIEVLLAKKIEENIWEVLMKPAKRLKIGERIRFDEKLDAVVLGKNNRGRRYLKFEPLGEDLMTTVERIGKVPLPPYIKRNYDLDIPEDRERYQTVFARKTGSVAAPTAGLHFDDGVIREIKERGTDICEITLNVGPGSFTPVNTDDVYKFRMEQESYEISRSTARKMERVLHSGRKIVAVGTTVVRSLESNYLIDSTGRFYPGTYYTDLFIYPGFKFNVISKLLTNFHLPMTTLIMLVSAFAGKELIMKAYNEAIKEKYRFYSYGDCMLII